jgi:hypothetical protein
MLRAGKRRNVKITQSPEAAPFFRMPVPITFHATDQAIKFYFDFDIIFHGMQNTSPYSQWHPRQMTSHNRVPYFSMRG